MSQYDSIISTKEFFISAFGKGYDLTVTSLQPLTILTIVVGGQLTRQSPSSSCTGEIRQAVWWPQGKGNGKDNDEVSLLRLVPESKPDCHIKRGKTFRLLTIK